MVLKKSFSKTFWIAGSVQSTKMDFDVFWARLIAQVEESSTNLNMNNNWWTFVIIITTTILTAAIGVIYFYLKKCQKSSPNLGFYDDHIILESPFKSKCQDLRPTSNNTKDYEEFVTNDSGVSMSSHNSPIFCSTKMSLLSSKNSSSSSFFDPNSTPPPVPPHIRKRWEKQISDGQEVKKRIASKQRHEWKRKARLLVPSPPLTEATPVTKNLFRIYKYK